MIFWFKLHILHQLQKLFYKLFYILSVLFRVNIYLAVLVNL